MKIWKTEAGQQAFKARSSLLSSRQRAVFILVDGNKSIDQVLAFTVSLGVKREDIDHLVEQGFLAAMPVAPAVAGTACDIEIVFDQLPCVPVRSRSPQERYQEAMPIATRLTAGLGLRGFRLNLAVEAASGCEGLLALLPRIQEAVGVKFCVELERALKD